MEDLKFEFTKNFVLRRILDETILVPVSPQLRQRDTLITLNPVAAKMLEKLRNGLSLVETEASLLSEFEVGTDELKQDLQSFARTMLDAEVLRELVPTS